MWDDVPHAHCGEASALAIGFQSGGVYLWDLVNDGVQMPIGPPTRPSLIARLRDHADRAAWGEFVDLYAPVVFRFARARGLQEADAADLTQEVLRLVATAMPRFDYSPTRGGFRAWLLHITKNRLRTFHRDTARALRLGAPIIDLDAARHFGKLSLAPSASLISLSSTSSMTLAPGAPAHL
jgi:hypothetical protein